jgi:hypothetical protein
MRDEVYTVARIQVVVSFIMTPCGMDGDYQHFRVSIFFRNIKTTCERTLCHKLESTSLHMVKQAQDGFVTARKYGNWLS